MFSETGFIYSLGHRLSAVSFFCQVQAGGLSLRPFFKKRSFYSERYRSRMAATWARVAPPGLARSKAH